MANPSTTPTAAPSVWGSKSPWTSNAAASTSSANGSDDNNVSLKDVMSEQLASKLQIEEEASYFNEVIAASEGQEQATPAPKLEEAFVVCCETTEGNETANDELLALMLQREFDKEHDNVLSREQSKYNGTSKVSLNFDKFKRLPQEELWTDSDTESDDDGIDRAVDKFEEDEKNNAGVTMGRQGFIKQGNKVVTTKHDLVTSGRRNAERVMSFSPNVSTGDGGSFDMQISNKVYSVLKRHAVSTGKRMARLHEKKEKSTVEGVMDETSSLMIFKLLNRGILDQVNGTISTGKEANVYHGIGGNPELQVTVGEVAIKVYKTTLNEFKHRDPYIKDDFRFRHRFSKQNPRKLIHLWAEKEMHNLVRIRKAGIPCPEVVMLKKHVLVMSFIGIEGKPAPILKEAVLSPTQMKQAYDETVEIMKKLWIKCSMVHADLSEFNLLWHLNRVWVIDVGQSVLKDHPHYLEFLLRDCYNITNFFSKRGVDTMSCSELFTTISEKALGEIQGVELLSKIEEFERNEEILAHGMANDGESFEQMFAKSVEDRNQAKTGASTKTTPLGKSPR